MKDNRAEREQNHFNQLAGKYESLYDLNQPAALYKVKNLCAKYVDFFDDAPSGCLLEIGCGTGFYTRHLAPCMVERKYIATDISEEMLVIAQATSSGIVKDNVSWKVENCLDYSFENNSVSIITGHGILHHLPIESSIKEMARVLKSGGKIAFYEPNILNPYVWALKTIPKMRPQGDTEDESALNPFKTAKLLKKYGFCKIKIEPYEFMLNSTSPRFIPLASKISYIISKIPFLRYWGGSLKIMAEKS